MNKFGMFVKFTVKPGQRDELVNILLEGEAALQADPECELYIVHISDDERDAIWVTELWSSPEAHKASLEHEDTKASIARAMPLIAGVESTLMKPVGGKGLRL